MVYTEFFRQIAKAWLAGKTIKAALVTNAYTPSQAHDAWADVSANEIVGFSGGGYSTGGFTLSNVIVGVNGPITIAEIDWDDIDNTAETIPACRYLIVYALGTFDTIVNPLISSFDFVTDQSSTAGDFDIATPANGAINLTDA